MIALQEDLDWQCYRLYGLLADDLAPLASLREMSLGERAFEIVLARKMRDEALQTTWFDRHGSTPTAETTDPLTLRRIAAIESNPQIALIEQPEYKRRWNDTPWEEKVTDALHAWLLDRLESYFDLDGRMDDYRSAGVPPVDSATGGTPVLQSTAKLADLAGRDPAFQTVAELYRVRPDFDVVKLVTELIEAESVPLLPVLRYKPSGLDKRRAWERTWELQRQEDTIDRRATKKGVGVNDGGWKVDTDDGQSPLNPAQADVLKKEKVGSIPPPPKYKSADFQKGDYWRLRGGLDVPKERWVSFPHCQGPDGLPLIAWAGYDHLQLAKAIAAPLRPRPGAGGRPRRPAAGAAAGLPDRAAAVAEAVAQRLRPRVRRGDGRLLRGIRAGRGPADGPYNRRSDGLAASKTRPWPFDIGAVNHATNSEAQAGTKPAARATGGRRERPRR